METAQFNQNSNHFIPKSGSGKVSILVLFVVSAIITLLGLAFGIYALLQNVSFSVMSAEIPGAVFAAVVVFLGVRYFLATLKLRKKISGKVFSWRNFKFKKSK